MSEGFWSKLKALWNRRDFVNSSREFVSEPQIQLGEVKRAVGPQHVIVVDIHMSFRSMIVFMVKWAIASIPAAIILFIVGLLLLPILTTLSKLL